jgi:hypothetical protein
MKVGSGVRKRPVADQFRTFELELELEASSWELEAGSSDSVVPGALSDLSHDELSAMEQATDLKTGVATQKLVGIARGFVAGNGVARLSHVPTRSFPRALPLGALPLLPHERLLRHDRGL